MKLTNYSHDDLVLVYKCNECPEDTGCKLYEQSDQKFKCICTHTAEPLLKGSTCLRRTVNSDQELKNTTIPVKVVGTGNQIGRSSKPISPYFLYPTAAACGLLLLVLAICFFKRKSMRRIFIKSKSHHCKPKSSSIKDNVQRRLLPERFVTNPTYEASTSVSVDLAITVFSPNQVKILTQIGQGCFGKVFKGEINEEPVAVKMVKKEYADDAIKEVETMASFCHSNILKLIGIMKEFESDAPSLIFEFMEHGDLVTVLRNSNGFLISGSKRQFSTREEEKGEEGFKLTYNKLLDVSYQIAQGMKYLSSQHFVHRDLAARNCLVSSNGDVKISDFGLSRDVYCCDYYKVGGSRLLPLRWMPIESLLYGRFTLESDVWAYGVLLWEIYTWGKQPYYGHSNEEVVQLILDGVLLSPPSDTPSVICQIMEGCWKTEPRDRMKFTTICEKLRKAMTSSYETQEHVKESDLYEIPSPNVNSVEYMQVI